jgi:hypothetical protein
MDQGLADTNCFPGRPVREVDDRGAELLQEAVAERLVRPRDGEDDDLLALAFELEDLRSHERLGDAGKPLQDVPEPPRLT